MEPITTITAAVLSQFQLTALVSTLVGGIVGNRADAWLCKGGDKLLDRIKKEAGAPENHDIQRAVRRAYLRATLLAVKKLHKGRSTKEKLIGKATPILGEQERYLREQLNQLDRPGVLFPETSLDQHHRAFFQPTGASTAERLPAMVKALKTSVLKELPLFYAPLETAVYQGWSDGDQLVDWYELTCAFFTEEYKTNPRIAEIIQLDYLAGLTETGANNSAILSQLEVQLSSWSQQYGPLLAQLQRIEDTLTRTEEKVDALSDNLRTVFKEELQSSQVGSPLPQRLSSVPSLLHPIFGRDKDLVQLTQQLKGSGSSVTIRGMGGVGKTTLATAYLAQEQSKLAHIIWISQTGDFATSLLSGGTAGQARLSELVGVEITDDPRTDAQRLLTELSRLQGPSLLVIDNAETDVNGYLGYLPGAPNWSVILTSREALKVSVQIELSNLDETNGIVLFQEHYPAGGEEKAIREIVREVGGHALTIELLAKTASARRLPLNKFRAMLRERGLEIGRRADDVTIAHDKDGQLQKVFPYLLAVFDLSQISEEARLLLYQLTIFPAEFTSFDLLASLLNKDPDKENEWDDFTALLKNLEDAGWVQADTALGYKLHRVVAEVVHRHPNNIYSPDILDKVIDRAAAYISYDELSKTNPALMVSELSFGDGVARILIEREMYTPSVASFYIVLALLQRKFGRFSDAAELLKKALLYNLAAYGEEHALVQANRSNLALVYISLGRYQEAGVLFETALRYDLFHYGEEHPTIQTRRSNLGMVYQALGRFSEVADILETTLGHNLNHFGEEHPAVQINRSNLSYAYSSLGRYQEAADLLEKALRHELAHYGDDHPTVQVTRGSLALVYKNLGRYLQAAELLEAALSYELGYYGEEHPTVQACRSSLATVYQDLGRYEEAARLLEPALQFSHTNYEEGHPTIQAIRSNLAVVYKDLERYPQAAELLEVVLHHNITHHGQEHPAVQVSRSNLALVYRDLKRYSQAAELLEVVLHHDVAHFDERHPTVQRSRSNLALVYIDLERYSEAADLLQAALQHNLSHYDEGHDAIQINLLNLGAVYWEMDNKQEGYKLVCLAQQHLLSDLGAEHPHSRTADKLISQMEAHFRTL